MRGRVLVVLALFVCLAMSNAHAGRIFGDIKMDGKPVAAGLPVTITLAPTDSAAAAAKIDASLADSTTTDKFGSYKLVVKPLGKCVLSVKMDKQLLSLEVFSYKEPTRYDLVVEKKDGKLSLRRK